ncbi:hypothetical protein [Candidatus Trichorickettsia mobilis]|uniref:hypothetical protein n=1 Tax=Candidatus Trichorickettsia mobilis TaxID=1346319 RepID=UPI00292FD5DB|nr:hypothetical protein [Candidatus Trichorickettsia mobilis]
MPGTLTQNLTAELGSALQGILTEKVKSLVPTEAVDQYQGLANEKIKEMGTKITDVSHGAIDTATTWLEGSINKGIDKLPFGDTVKDTLKEVNSGLCATINVVGKALVDTAIESGKKIVTNVVESLGSAAKSIWSGVCNFLSGKETKDQVLEDAKKTVNTAVDNIKTGTISAAKEGANKITSTAKTGVEEISGQASKGVQKAAHEVVGGFTKKLEESRSNPPSTDKGKF